MYVHPTFLPAPAGCFLHQAYKTRQGIGWHVSLVTCWQLVAGRILPVLLGQLQVEEKWRASIIEQDGRFFSVKTGREIELTVDDRGVLGMRRFVEKVIAEKEES